MGDVVNGGGWNDTRSGFGGAAFSRAGPPGAGRTRLGAAVGMMRSRRSGRPTGALATTDDTGYGRFAPGLPRVVV
jgi:hypothetical protein